MKNNYLKIIESATGLSEEGQKLVESAYRTGREDGFQDGFWSGYDEGYDEGVSDAINLAR